MAEKGKPGPIKDKVHATRIKQMVLAFVDSKGVVCTNYVPRGTTVNVSSIVDAGQVLEDFQAEEAGDGVWRMVVPL